MKKTIIASLLSTLMLSGCISTGGESADEPLSYDVLREKGSELAISSDDSHYEPSTVVEVETVRLAVNTAFLAAKPAYERYTEELIATPALGNFFAATEAASTDEEKKAIYDALSPKNKATVDKFLASSMFSEIMSGLGDAAKPALKSVAMMTTINASDALQNVGFLNLINEKDKFSHTTDQVLYLNDSVISAYNNYKVVSSFNTAK
ncbi:MULTISPECIES: hypothetical protein [Vibrio]|uniref:Lipoprotein n=1 Tax=Vibrio cortegadensis TaxID=1328770 RepID=A0ABV4M3G0_9VIBR|nr:hypothetical protein [Vibrio genomosp. F6]TKF21505.1 hypothetical protein FCV43_09215 [Vibrio genomosp. F6]